MTHSDRLEWEAETIGVDAAIARARADRHPGDPVLEENARQAERAAERAREHYEQRRATSMTPTRHARAQERRA